MMKRTLLVLALLALVQSSQSTTAWKKDLELSRISTNIHCDFPIVDANDYQTFDDIPFTNIPIIIQNLTDNWVAHENWQKGNLLKKYGNRYVRSGSEVSIVYSAGNSEFSSTLEEFVRLFDQYTEKQTFLSQDPEMGDQFLFDTTILRAIPELRNDFTVPNLFQDWDRPEREQNYSIWHMLSLGPSRSGLSFHNHGQTWIAVVHGMKRWFVYPPGYGPPRDLDAQVPPTLTVWEWFVNYYPQLLGFEKPGFVDSDDMDIGYRPLECLQREGDLLYLPSLWNHLTLNVGETIAVGAQEGLETQERFSSLILTLLPHIGISLYYKSLSELEAFRRNLNFNETTRVIQMTNDDQLTSYFEFTGDSAIVVRYNPQDWEDGHLLNHLSALSVHCDVIALADAAVYSDQLILQVFHGLDSPVWQENGLCSMNISVPIDNSQSLPKISELFPYNIQGSLRTIPMKVRIEMDKAIFFFRKALEIKPLQPDSIQLISEVYGKLGKVEEVKSLITAAEQGFDTIHATYQISKKSLASLYFKLVLVCENIGLYDNILRLSKKCIENDEKLIFCWKSNLQQMIRQQWEDQSAFHQEISRFKHILEEQFHPDHLLASYARDEDIISLIDAIIDRYY